MKLHDLVEDGRIVKGVNTTVDVDTDEIKVQAAKFGNTVDKDGFPPTHKKKVKGSTTNVLFNLGLTEGYKLQLERDRKMLVLNITNTKTGHRTEVRGKPGYESGNYDPNDDLHQLLDTIGKSANISELINGEVVTINPKHPDAEKAKAATDKAYSEARYTAYEWALMEGGHTIDETPKKRSDLFAQMENFADGKKKVNEALDNPYPISWSEKGPDIYIANSQNDLEIFIADEEDKGVWDISFMRSKSMRATQEGNEFRIFATVKLAIIQWWKDIQNKKLPVNKIVFSASKDDSDGRASLYKRFASMFAQKIGYRLEIRHEALGDDINDVFVLSNPNVEENFADGKKKGKSRPGRVKRSGASCNGSVTSLRKRAKNSSGEKARMYHWCANMKSGRKKK